jgi:hypothetical protein
MLTLHSYHSKQMLGGLLHVGTHVTGVLWMGCRAIQFGHCNISNCRIRAVLVRSVGHVDAKFGMTPCPLNWSTDSQYPHKLGDKETFTISVFA